MKVIKKQLNEEERTVHTKANGDKLVANSSGHGYSAYTKNNVHIGHIEAETDAEAISNFSSRTPKYESMNEDIVSLESDANRYLDFEISEMTATVRNITSNMTERELIRLVSLCRDFYTALEVIAEHHDVPVREEVDDDYDDLSSFNECGEARMTEALYNGDMDEDFPRRSGIDFGAIDWQVGAMLGEEKLGDKWIEFYCSDERPAPNGEKRIKFDANGETMSLHGSMITDNGKIKVYIRNGSEAVCTSAEEIARFLAGEFGLSI